MSDPQGREVEFWQKLVTCLEAQAQVIQRYKLEPPKDVGRVFEPTMGVPKAEQAFWQNMRRNLLSQAAVIKTSKIGESAGVRVGKRRRYRPPKLDGRPGER